MRPVLTALSFLILAAPVVGAPRHPSTVDARPTEAPAPLEPGLVRNVAAVPKAAGNHVGTVTFSEGCALSGVGVGVAFDGENLWFTCQIQSPDLFRADPLTGVVDASFTVVGGLGALVYDCTDNSILAGWGGGDAGGVVRKITLDANQDVTGSSVLFDAGPHPVSCGLLDGIALDVTTNPKMVYLSDDCSTIVHRYLYDGTHVEALDDSPWTGPDCYNSGLALGGGDLYQGANGCGHVYAHAKTPWPMVGPNSFDFSTQVPNDPGFRDEGLACDDASFAVDVMWSMEAYEPRRAHAFEIPDGSCLSCAAVPPGGCECILGQPPDEDEEPPLISGVPADVIVSCDDVPPVAEASASDACDPAPVLSFAEVEVPGACPGERVITRTWTATDACGNESVAVQVITVADTTPPRIGGLKKACLWPPNHWMVCFTRADFEVDVTDDCSDVVTWRLAGCLSDQPEDDLGDGHFLPDCVIGEDGSVCARAERQGTVPAGRHYGVLVVAVDACGNESEPTLVGDIYVPHDQSPHEDCLDPTKVGIKNGPHTSER